MSKMVSLAINLANKSKEKKMYSKKLIELKAKRIERLLTPPEGREFYFSVYNPGGRQGYQIGWRDIKNGAEYPICYHAHVNGKTLYAMMEGIEIGFDLAKKSRALTWDSGLKPLSDPV